MRYLLLLTCLTASAGSLKYSRDTVCASVAKAEKAYNHEKAKLDKKDIELQEKRDKAITAALRVYSKALKSLMKDCTRRGDIEKAIEIRNEQKLVQEMICGERPVNFKMEGMDEVKSRVKLPHRIDYSISIYRAKKMGLMKGWTAEQILEYGRQRSEYHKMLRKKKND